MRGREGPGAWLKTVSSNDGELVLEIGGEVDLASVGTIGQALDDALAGKPGKVVFELRELSFMDTSGIALLVSTAQRVDQVELRYPSSTVRRVIELAGLSGTLPITSG